MVILGVVTLGCAGCSPGAGVSLDPLESGLDSGAAGDDSAPDTGETGLAPVPDADGDGHDAVAFGGDDCDDTLANVYPGAEEACDGLDQDCDGVAIPHGSCGDPRAIEISAQWVIRGSIEGQRAVLAQTLGDVDGDGLQDVALNGQWPDAGGVSMSAAALLSGGSLPQAPTLDPEHVRMWTGAYMADLLLGAQAAGDVNADGLADIWIPAEGDDLYEGGLFLFTGRAGGWPTGVSPARDSADGWWYQDDRDWNVGHYLVSGGDLDGDGTADAILTSGNQETGEACWSFVFGSAGLTDGPTPISGLDFVSYRTDEFEGTVRSRLPDLDGDGADEVAALPVGALFLMRGPDAVATDDRPVLDRGEFVTYDRGSGLDTSVPWPVPGDAPDLDGDGLRDWAAIDLEKDSASDRRYCVMAFTGGFPSGNLAKVEHARICGDDTDPFTDEYGAVPSQWTSDVDGDGVGDLAITRYTDERGPEYCLVSSASLVAGGVVDPDTPTGPCFAWESAEEELAVADLTGDGLPELIFSDWSWDSPTAGEMAGRIRIIEGFEIPWDDPTKWAR